MTDVDKLVVATVILVLLGGSYVVAVATFATDYLVAATLAYVVVALALLGRILTKTEND